MYTAGLRKGSAAVVSTSPTFYGVSNPNKAEVIRLLVENYTGPTVTVDQRLQLNSMGFTAFDITEMMRVATATQGGSSVVSGTPAVIETDQVVFQLGQYAGQVMEIAEGTRFREAYDMLSEAKASVDANTQDPGFLQFLIDTMIRNDKLKYETETQLILDAVGIVLPEGVHLEGTIAYDEEQLRIADAASRGVGGDAGLGDTDTGDSDSIEVITIGGVETHQDSVGGDTEGHYHADAVAESGALRTQITLMSDPTTGERLIDGQFNTFTNNLLGLDSSGTTDVTGNTLDYLGVNDKLLVDSSTVFQPIIVYPSGGLNVDLGQYDIVEKADGSGYSLYAATDEFTLTGNNKANFDENVTEALGATGVNVLPVATMNSTFTLDQWRDTTTHGMDRALNATHFSGEGGAWARQDGVVPVYFVRGMGGYAAGQGYTELDGTRVQYAMMGDIAIEGLAKIGDVDNRNAGTLIFNEDREFGGEGQDLASATRRASAGEQMGTVIHEATHGIGANHGFMSDDILINKMMDDAGNLGIQMFGLDGDKREAFASVIRSRIKAGTYTGDIKEELGRFQNA